MNKNKERIEVKIIKIEKILNALSNNELEPHIITATFEFLLEYKHRLKKQREAQKKITPEKRLAYVKAYRAKQKLQSNVVKEIDELLK